LVTDLLARVVGASERFVARYNSFFRKTIYCSSLAGRELADDLMQEVYAYLWADDFHVLRQWKGECPLQAYMYTVISRLVWDRLRRLQPRCEALSNDPFVEASALDAHLAMEGTPEQIVCVAESIAAVHGALEKLNAQDRNILELRYFQDLSYREIADLLGITTTNAGVRLARALGRLKRMVEQRLKPRVALQCLSTNSPESHGLGYRKDFLDAVLRHEEERDASQSAWFSFKREMSACNKTDSSSLIWSETGRNVLLHWNRSGS
jgi:RNA polymerase sigma-70 factor (ECF subfamily)